VVLALFVGVQHLVDFQVVEREFFNIISESILTSQPDIAYSIVDSDLTETLYRCTEIDINYLNIRIDG
jgi:hypothetical protein